MRMYDRLQFDAAAQVRYTDRGYLTAMPRVARTGIQLYYGSELGKVGDDAKKIYRVLRSEDQVFSTDAMHSFAHLPFTDDHPPVQVDASNWKKYATGQAGSEVARDGEFIRVPMVLMDKTAIQKFKDGKAEISMGYDCEIDFTAGTHPKYGAFDASQRNPRGNHYAVVDAARGGEKLRIGDGTGAAVNVSVHADGLRAIMDGKVDKTGPLAECTMCLADKAYPFAKADGTVSLAGLRACKADAIAKGDGDILAAVDSMLAQLESDTSTTSTHDAAHTQETAMKLVTIDGVSVQVDNDQSAQIIDRAMQKLTADLKAARDAFGKEEEENKANKKKMSEDAAAHATVLATKDAEIATLKKQVEDAKLTPAKLDQLVKDRAVVAGKARAILGDKLVVDGKTDTEIMAQVVSSKLGDTAKDWNADQIKISFDTLTAQVKPVDQGVSGIVDTARAFSGPSDSSDARSKADAAILARDQKLTNAWQGEQKH